MVSRAVAFLWLSVALIACTDPICGPIERCEVSTAACQQRVMDVAACYLQVEPREVKGLVRVRSRDELLKEWKAAERATPEDADSEHWRRGLALMGLHVLLDEPDALLEHRLDNLAGYYSDDDDRVTLVDGPWLRDRERAVLVLAHELTHALQAEHGRADVPPWTDAVLAARAMLEGEAELVELLASAEGYGFELGTFLPARLRPTDLWPPYAVPWLDAYRTFTYGFGLWWTGEAWKARGIERVRRAVIEPPASARHVMEGFGADDPVSANAAAAFAASARPLLPDPYRFVDRDRLGAWFLRWLDVEGWVGDSFSVFYDADADVTVSVWRIGFEESAQARRAASQIASLLESEQGYWLHDRGLEVDLTANATHATEVDEDRAGVTWIAVSEPDFPLEPLGFEAWPDELPPRLKRAFRQPFPCQVEHP